MINQLMKVLALLSFFIASAVFAATSPLENRWIELGPQNSVILRVITTAPTCPMVKINHQLQNMEVHAAPNAQFQITTCQLVIPANAKTLSVAGHLMRLPKANPTKIVIIGDTGCRLKKNVNPQGCDDPTQWPFPTVAHSAAVWKPDLVIHVGDYLYREASCPPDDKLCAGSPFGDDWPAWKADFFQPAKPLLQAAPWILVRGNHETCDRGGYGWTHLLDPYSFQECHDHSPLYSVDIGNGTRLFIIDSANASDYLAPPEQVNWYADYINVVSKSDAPHNWVITHKPFWFIYDESQLNQALQTHFLNTLETAWDNVAPDNVDLLLAGHVHRFQTLNFAQNRPPQVIVGASGTRLDAALPQTSLNGYEVANMAISQGLSLNEFGYMTMERKKDNWFAQIRDAHGKILANCILQQRQFNCQETALATGEQQH